MQNRSGGVHEQYHVVTHKCVENVLVVAPAIAIKQHVEVIWEERHTHTHTHINQMASRRPSTWTQTAIPSCTATVLSHPVRLIMRTPASSSHLHPEREESVHFSRSVRNPSAGPLISLTCCSRWFPFAPPDSNHNQIMIDCQRLHDSQPEIPLII